MSLIRCPLNDAAFISINRQALLGPEGALLFSDLEQCVRGTAQLLLTAGCRPTERLALAAPTGWRGVVVLLGAIRAGLVACPLPPATPAASASPLAALGAVPWVGATAPPNGHSAIRQTWTWEALTGFTAPLPRHEIIRLPAETLTTICWNPGAPPTPESARGYSWGDHYYRARRINQRLRLHSGDICLLQTPPGTIGACDLLFSTLLAGAALALPAAAPLTDNLITHEATIAWVTEPALATALDNGLCAKMIPTLRALIIETPTISSALSAAARAAGLTVQAAPEQPENQAGQRQVNG
ncbi:MAG: AMP-binding protein [Candidatus Marinimicrobia bacterium]|nr:AMP-binding protein [Candidatus Neomarinimicrobiota bacterium]